MRNPKAVLSRVIEDTRASVTFTSQIAWTPLPSVVFATIIAEPAAMAVTVPSAPTVAMSVLELSHLMVCAASAGITLAVSTAVTFTVRSS